MVHVKFGCVIELRTPYGSLDMAAESEITLVELNNALDWDDNFNLERSYPFTLPWTPVNAGIFKQADEPEAYGSVVSLPAELYLHGGLEFGGRLYILQTERGRYYSVTLAHDRSIIKSDTLLPDIDWDGPYTTPLTEGRHETTDQLGDILAGDARYALPVIKQEHTSSLGSATHLNHYSMAIGGYQHWGNLAPQIFLRHVVTRIAATWKLKLQSCLDTDEELRKVLLFSLWNARTVQVLSTSPADAVVIYGEIKPELLVPKISVRELLNFLRWKFGLGCYIGWDGMVVYSLRDALRKRNELDITDYISGEGVMEVNAVEAEGYTFLNECDPKDEAKVWWEEVNNAKIKGSVDTVTDLLPLTGVADGDVYLVHEVQRYYYYYEELNVWVNYMYRSTPRTVYGSGAIEMRLLPGNVQTDMVYDPRNNVEWMVPHTEYVPDDVTTRIAEAAPRVMIYHGMQESKLSGGLKPEYPYAAWHNYDSNYALVGNMDLRDVDTYGLHARYRTLRMYLQEQQKRPTLYLRNCHDLMRRLRPDVVLRIKDNLYMWTEKSRTYNRAGQEMVELKLVKI